MLRTRVLKFTLLRFMSSRRRQRRDAVYYQPNRRTMDDFTNNVEFNYLYYSVFKCSLKLTHIICGQYA